MSEKINIVFDFGGVLLDWNPRHLYRKLFDGDDEAMEDFLEEIDFYTWNHRQDLGRPFAEAVADLSAQYPHRAPLIAAFADRWEETLAGPIRQSVDILQALRQKGYPLYGLTNWAAETFYRIRHEHDFLDWFEAIVVSGDVGLAKPDLAIYQVLLEQIMAPAERCLFIDDSQANVVAADQLGFMTIHYQAPGQLHGELASRGLL